jgi:hypothetical protein
MFDLRTAGGQGLLRSTRRTWGTPPTARAAALTTETPTGMETNGCEKNLNFAQAGVGNAPVLEVEVVLALIQPILQATQILDHGERRHGVSGGFGEARAVADASMPIQALYQATARTVYAGGSNQLPGGRRTMTCSHSFFSAARTK